MLQVEPETPRAANIVLEVPGWSGHRAGQHVDVRLTAEDGYQAQRSYSIASAPHETRLVLTVERLDDGEVSSYLVGELRVGDPLELRGPIGGYFVWDEPLGGPLLWVAGGSGVVPFRAMWRHRRALGSAVPVRLLCSARSLPLLIYSDELMELSPEGVAVSVTLSREQPEGWQGHRGRIDRDLLAMVGWRPEERPLSYICGPSAFVETAANALVDLGHDATRIRTERFGGAGT
ncbi:MAG: ferredoxin reductase [Friedmanniella sp.]